MKNVIIKTKNGIKYAHLAVDPDVVSCPVDRNNRRCGSWCIWFDIGQTRKNEPMYLMCKDVILAEIVEAKP